MATFIVFYGSLFGILILFIFKAIELKKGTRFFSALHLKIDGWFHSQLFKVKILISYFNWKTFYLLSVFLFKELIRISKIVFLWIGDLDFVKKLQGRYGFGKTPNGLKNGNVSEYLAKIKDKKNNHI